MGKRVLTRNDLAFDAAFPVIDGKCAMPTCSVQLKGRRRRWCSDECSREAWIQINVQRGVSTYIRLALKKRDREICASCGTDLAMARRILRYAERSIWDWEYSGGEWGIWDAAHEMRWVLEHKILWPLFGERRTSGQFWQGDHIKEVAAGGEHSMENLQTLCTICHKAKTKEFVRRKDPIDQQGLFL